MKIARQRVSATKSGNGLQKTSKPSLSGGLVTIYIFFYFSVALVADRGKSPQLRGFPRQPARQRECNKVGNEVGFSERKLHLLCDLHKSLRNFFGSVAGIRCRGFTLPALLPAVFREHPGIGKVVPACDTMVHNVVDLPDFPLLRLVKGVVQGFPEKLLGTHYAAGVAVKVGLDHPGLGVLRHEIPLVFFEIAHHFGAERQLKIPTAVNGHGFRP